MSKFCRIELWKLLWNKFDENRFRARNCRAASLLNNKTWRLITMKNRDSQTQRLIPFILHHNYFEWYFCPRWVPSILIVTASDLYWPHYANISCSSLSHWQCIEAERVLPMSEDDNWALWIVSPDCHHLQCRLRRISCEYQGWEPWAEILVSRTIFLLLQATLLFDCVPFSALDMWFD